MTLILNNQDLKSVLDMPACVEALYQGLKAYSRGDAARRPRIDLFAPTSRPKEFVCFSSMEGIVRGGYYAIRIKPEIISSPEINGRRRRVRYSYRHGFDGGLILLFHTENAELVAIMNDGYIQHMRTGATAALGAKYLAGPEAETVGILGSGGMARSFALGFAAVRKIKTIKVYSLDEEHLKVYCHEMSEKLAIEVVPMKNPQQVVQGSDIVACCTNSLEPVLKGRWLEPGMYVANVSHRELDQAVLRRITLVGYLTFKRNPLNVSGFSDHNFEIRNAMVYLAGQPNERQHIPVGRERRIAMPNARWVACIDWKTETPLGRESKEDIAFLAELSAGSLPGGSSSGGIQGLQLASVAGRAYELALARGLGISMDTQLFLQNIP